MLSCIGRIGLFAVALGLVACASYEPRPLDPAESARKLAGRSLRDPGLRAFAQRVRGGSQASWPPAAFGLSELTVAGLYFHPDLDVARSSVELARASEQTASQRPNPALSVTPSHGGTETSPSPWYLTALLNVTLETGGKRDARTALSRRQIETARLRVTEAAWSVRDRIRRALIALRLAEQTEQLLETQQDLVDENERRVSERYAVGAASAFEQLQAQLAARASMLALRDAQRQAAEARVALAGSIGVLPEALEGLAFTYDELDAAPTSDAVSDMRRLALTHRADLLAALSTYAEREAALRLEVANQYPDLHFGPGYTFNAGEHRWSLGLLNLSLPVFHQNGGPIAVARARRDEAAAQFLALQLRVLEAVGRAQAAYQGALHKRADADAMWAQSESQLQRADAQLSVGALSQADLVAVRLQRSQAEVTRLSASAALQLALADLESSVQSPFGLAPSSWQDAPARTQASSDDTQRASR